MVVQIGLKQLRHFGKTLARRKGGSQQLDAISRFLCDVQPHQLIKHGTRPNVVAHAGYQRVKTSAISGTRQGAWGPVGVDKRRLAQPAYHHLSDHIQGFFKLGSAALITLRSGHFTHIAPVNPRTQADRTVSQRRALSA